MLEQKVQQAAAFGGAPALELGGERTADVESLVTPILVAADDRVDCPWRICRILAIQAGQALGAMHGICGSKLFLQRGGQFVEGKMLIGEGRVAANIGSLERIQHRDLWRCQLITHVAVPVLVRVLGLAPVLKLHELRIVSAFVERVLLELAPSPGER